MVRPDAFWRRLRGGLLALALAIAAGVLLVSAARYELREAESLYRNAQAGLDSALRRHRAATADRAVYDEYVTAYEALQRRGVIGAESRLDWVEALERINRSLALPVLRYEIAPKAPVLPPEGSVDDQQRIRLFRSSMSVDIRALHEGDLLALLDGLRRHTSGRFEVRDCDVRLAGATRLTVRETRTPDLVALCHLEWYTLQIDDDVAPGEPR